MTDYFRLPMLQALTFPHLQFGPRCSVCDAYGITGPQNCRSGSFRTPPNIQHWLIWKNHIVAIEDANLILARQLIPCRTDCYNFSCV